MRVIQLPVCSKLLVHHGLARAFNVDNHQALFFCRHIGVGACQINSLCIRHGHHGTGVFGLLRVGNIDHFQPFGCGDEQVAELHRCGTSILQGQGGDVARLQGVIDINKHQPLGRGDVSVVPAQGNVACTAQYSVFVPAYRALEEVVAGLAVCQCVHIHCNQAFFAVGYEGVVVDRVEWLFHIGNAHQVALVFLGVDGLVGG